ncbi:hypothetical protein NT6N_29970 [Oceaniferula spumae]|uniref:Uncharacterized protein n=1 Tax=Oceaniferula spumae TaxID=2979115 RepID=A0AAT9FPB1_9BACT
MKKIRTAQGTVLRWAGYFVAFYFSSYFLLSSMGTYGPAAYGTNGIKSYRWYPRGIGVGHPSTYVIGIVYSPLWALDRAHWHTREKSRTGQYPKTDDYPW